MDAPRYGPPPTAQDATFEPYAQSGTTHGGGVLVAPDNNRAHPLGEVGDTRQVKGTQPIPAQSAIIDYDQWKQKQSQLLSAASSIYMHM